MTNRSQKSGQRTAICHFSFIICHWSFAKSLSSAVVRKNVAPASSRQTVLLTQKELSRLTCRRDAGATILSHDLRLYGEGFWVAAMPICVHLCSSVVSFCATERAYGCIVWYPSRSSACVKVTRARLFLQTWAPVSLSGSSPCRLRWRLPSLQACPRSAGFSRRSWRAF